MRTTIALGLSLFIAATAPGQEPADQQGFEDRDRPASRPADRIRAITDLESGDGFAARYPGDQSIRKDPRTIFSEDFEGRQPFAGWTDRKNPDRVRVVEDQANSGFFSLAIESDVKGEHGGHLFKRLRIGYDTIHVRFYTRFAAPAEHVQHFVQISADEPPRSFPLGGAGVCPDGGARFATEVGPLGAAGLPAPGAWRLQSYWCEMAISDDGKYWGNDFAPPTPIPVPSDRWVCVEAMIKANSAPTAADGMQALWIDGQLAAAYEGFRWRTDPRLKLNGVCLRCWTTEEGAVRQGSIVALERTTVFFDDVVVATRYIGPQRPLPPPTQGMR